MAYDNFKGKSRDINLLKAESYFDNFIDQDTDDKKTYLIQDFEGRCSVGTYFLIQSTKDQERRVIEIVRSSEQDFDCKLSPDNPTAIKLSRKRRGEYIEINREFYKILNIGRYGAKKKLKNSNIDKSSYSNANNILNNTNKKTNQIYKKKWIKNKNLIQEKERTKRLDIGDSFILKDLEFGDILDFQIVDKSEEDISKNKISNDYLLAIEVANSKLNELIKMQGDEKFKILEINNFSSKQKIGKLDASEKIISKLKIGNAFKLENIKTNAIEEYEIVEDERENERLNLLGINSELVSLVDSSEVGGIIKVPSELFFEKYRIIYIGDKPIREKKFENDIKDNSKGKSKEGSKKKQEIDKLGESKLKDTTDILEILDLKEKRFKPGSYFKVENLYNKKKYKYTIVERKRQNYKYKLIGPESDLAIEVANGKVGDILRFITTKTRYNRTYKITYINGTYKEIKNTYGERKLKIGTIIKLRNVGKKEIQYYMIVNKNRVDLKNRFITNNTPLSLTVANHEVGDIIKVRNNKYEILNITNNIKCWLKLKSKFPLDLTQWFFLQVFSYFNCFFL